MNQSKVRVETLLWTNVGAHVFKDKAIFWAKRFLESWNCWFLLFVEWSRQERHLGCETSTNHEGGKKFLGSFIQFWIGVASTFSTWQSLQTQLKKSMKFYWNPLQAPKKPSSFCRQPVQWSQDCERLSCWSSKSLKKCLVLHKTSSG